MPLRAADSRYMPPWGLLDWSEFAGAMRALNSITPMMIGTATLANRTEIHIAAPLWSNHGLSWAD